MLPAASAYEKNGTVTNVCGEVQKLKQAVKVMGTKTDLEIMGSIAKEMKLNLGIWLPDKVFAEIRKTVHGYDVPLPVVDTGGAAPTMPLNGRVPALPGAIQSAGDTLFTSGSMSRYSKILNAVIESPGELYRGQALMNYYLLSLIKTAIVVGIFMHVLAYLQWIERKVIAHVQLRVGPRRVGPHGLLQPLADVIKLITKEDILPSHVNKVFYFLAPFIAVTFALIAISVIPFGPDHHRRRRAHRDAADGSEYRRPVHLRNFRPGRVRRGPGGLGVEQQVRADGRTAQLGADDQLRTADGAGAGGAAADSEYAQLARDRERPGGLLLGFIPRWSIFQMPFPQIFSFILFLIAGFAETNRVPFDLPEAENELVAGFHVEYASMKFASFFMAEYANMVTVSCVATLLFLGGWHPIFPEKYGSGLIPVLIFAASAAAVLLSRRQSGAAVRQDHAAGVRRAVSGRRGDIPAASGAVHSFAAVLVCGEGLHHPVRVHLGPRDSAAVPLRSADELRLDLHVPRGAGQLVHHGPSGGPFPLIWTLSCS